MKAITGRTYAQILNNKVNWIFSQSQMSEWADITDFPSRIDGVIQVIDITNVTPIPLVGWTYTPGVNGSLGTFAP